MDFIKAGASKDSFAPDKQTVLEGQQSRLHQRTRCSTVWKVIWVTLMISSMILFKNIHLSNPGTTIDIHKFSDDWKANKLHSFKRPEPQFEHCNSTEYTKSLQFYLNVRQDAPGLRMWQFVELSFTPQPELHKNLRGRVRVEPGDDQQVSDIEVTFTRSGRDKNSVDAVLYAWSDSAFYVYGPRDGQPACVEVEVIIRLRPSPARTLDMFKIYSTLLDIRMDGSPTWEINHLILHTSHGNSEFWGIRPGDPLRLHNVTSSSVSGDIFGYYLANAHLNVHNLRGRSGVVIMPNYNRPFKPETITVTSDSGPLHVEMVQPYWPPHPLSHITTVYSASGDVFAAVPHGSVTNLTTGSGKLTAVILPYGTDDRKAKSEIYTSSGSASTWVRLASSDPQSLEGRYDPLLRTKSVHEVGEGDLTLWYPHSWYGELEGWYGDGTLDFIPYPWDVAKWADGHVWARKGWEGEGYSETEARVREGDLTVKVGWD